MEAVDKAVKRVKQGIFALPTDKKPEMWKSYINFMKKISETDPKLVSAWILQDLLMEELFKISIL